MFDLYTNCQKPTPFLRWAGGKKWLKKEIDKIVKIGDFKNYHEPFIGGGFMLFYLDPVKAFISDTNEDLIQTYLSIKSNPNEVIDQLQKFKKDKESYYHIRKTQYKDIYKESAKFIYLNQMSFNGVYRVNAKGQYNVPYGYRNSYNFNYENIYAVSKFLKKVTIKSGDFFKSSKNIKAGDLVFLDPPYTIAHNNNGFIQYNQKLFSLDDQYRLSKLIDLIKERDAFYILTNAAHYKVKEIFDKSDKVISLSRASVIGAQNSSRGQYSEFLFTNI